MRRRLSLMLLGVLLGVCTIAVLHYRALSMRRAHPAGLHTHADSIAALDSASRADARAAQDTMCFASRVGIPCAPR